MEINQERAGTALVIRLSGRLDTGTAPKLSETLAQSLDGVTQLELNLENVDYISSAGLRVLLAAQKQMMKQGKMWVSGVNETVLEVFEITGFTEVLTIK